MALFKFGDLMRTGWTEFGFWKSVIAQTRVLNHRHTWCRDILIDGMP